MAHKILIVDDEVHIRTLLEQTLEDVASDLDVEIFSATNGREALSVIEAERPELVFLDVMMPEMSGYQVCEKVRADDALKHIKIVLLTAKGQEVDRRLGLTAGADLYVTKPFDPDEIVELAMSTLQA